MTATFEFDRLLESVLAADGPQTVPATVVEAALTQSRTLKQRRPRVSVLDRQAWPAGRRALPSGSRPIPSALVRVLLMALIATALIALGVVGSALLREDPVPKQLNSRFFRDFEYAIPVESTMRVSAISRLEMVAWVDGPDLWPIATGEEGAGGGGEPQPGQVRGVVIGSGGEAWSHGNGGRFMLRTAPAEFLTDLRDTAHTPMGPIEQTTLDGSPALTVMLPGTGGSDIHVTGRMLGLSGTYVQVTMPSRLIVSEVDGDTIFVLIWARTAQVLEAWLPVADEFVESIHFVPD
jgi:hypothetical protein